MPVVERTYYDVTHVYDFDGGPNFSHFRENGFVTCPVHCAHAATSGSALPAATYHLPDIDCVNANLALSGSSSRKQKQKKKKNPSLAVKTPSRWMILLGTFMGSGIMRVQRLALHFLILLFGLFVSLSSLCFVFF